MKIKQTQLEKNAVGKGHLEAHKDLPAPIKNLFKIEIKDINEELLISALKKYKAVVITENKLIQLVAADRKIYELQKRQPHTRYKNFEFRHGEVLWDIVLDHAMQGWCSIGENEKNEKEFILFSPYLNPVLMVHLQDYIAQNPIPIRQQFFSAVENLQNQSSGFQIIEDTKNKIRLGISADPEIIQNLSNLGKKKTSNKINFNAFEFLTEKTKNAPAQIFPVAVLNPDNIYIVDKNPETPACIITGNMALLDLYLP